MPIQEPAECIGNGKQVQPARGKNNVGVVANFDGNFSNNYEGVTNCRRSTRIPYGEGLSQEFVHQPDITPNDQDAQVDGVHEYGYREVE